MPVCLFVDYEDADDFVGDYTENLSAGGTFVHTTRVLERGTMIVLVLAFPALLEPIRLEGVVRWSRGGRQPGVGIEFRTGRDYAKLDAVVELIQARDPRAVARVVKVLIADDNPHISELICSGLGASAKHSFGGAVRFRFATVENGAAAIELLRSAPFDVAIIDVYLPILDGVKVIERARAEVELVDLPIIATSTSGDAARSSALAAGANKFLTKPMRLRDVLETMRQLVPLDA